MTKYGMSVEDCKLFKLMQDTDDNTLAPKEWVSYRFEVFDGPWDSLGDWCIKPFPNEKCAKAYFAANKINNYWFINKEN